MKTLLSSLINFIPHAFAETETEVDCSNPQTQQEKNACLNQKLNQLLISEEEFVNQQAPTKNEGTSLAQGDIATDFIPFFINLGISIAGTMVFIAFLYAGYLLVFANDKEEDIEKGKKILTYAVVGAIMVAISYALVFGVANLDLN